MKRSQLRELEVRDSDEQIPLLSEVFAAIPPGVSVQVELKQTGIAADVLRHIDDDVGVDARVTSFLPSALTEVQEHDPNVVCGATCSARK